jgi:hypothetical protein
MSSRVPRTILGPGREVVAAASPTELAAASAGLPAEYVSDQRRMASALTVGEHVPLEHMPH